MNNLKIKAYKRVLKEVSEKYEGAEQLVNSRLEEMCSQEKLFSGKIISMFSDSFLQVK